jgi:hypothetical protein
MGRSYLLTFLGPVIEVSPLLETNGIEVSCPSFGDGNRFSFKNIVFSSYLEFQTMDKIHKPSDSEHILCFDFYILELF